MTDEDENVHNASSLSGRITKSLAEEHASYRQNVLYTLLSDATFYDAVNELSSTLKLRRPGSRLEDEFLDNFIVTNLLQQGLVDVNDADHEIVKEKKARKFFNAALAKTLSEHGVPQKYAPIIREYLVLGSVNEISSADEISVDVNVSTQELILTLSPKLSKADLVSQLPTIFKYWEGHRGKVSNPRHFSAKRAALLSREKQNSSNISLAKKHGMYEDNVKQEIKRIRDRRKQLISDTK